MTLTIVDPDPVAPADQINTLHGEMTGHMTMAVKKAIEIGRLLSEQKGRLAHGEWIPWVENNLTFGRIQTAKYMRVYDRRDQLNVHSNVHLKGIDQALSLLTEPRDPEPIPEPDDPPPPAAEQIVEREIVYEQDPDAVRRLAEAEKLASESEALLLDKNQEYHDLSIQHEKMKVELERLRKLDADKEKIEATLHDINELKGRQAAMFKDAESTKLVYQVLVRSREFFTREVMQIAALHIRPGAIDAMQMDFQGLIDLVENWLAALKEKFINE